MFVLSTLHSKIKMNARQDNDIITTLISGMSDIYTFPISLSPIYLSLTHSLTASMLVYSNYVDGSSWNYWNAVRKKKPIHIWKSRLYSNTNWLLSLTINSCIWPKVMLHSLTTMRPPLLNASITIYYFSLSFCTILHISLLYTT